MSTETLILGDCLEKLREIEDGGVDAIVTDPPYELGFMGKSWDSTGIANSVEMWKECLRVLKPGGYLLSFSATRTYHRMACAIEDAGFEVRDMIEWIYSTGFPKSHNVFKQLKKECTCGNMEAYEQGTKTLSKHDLRPVQESDISKEITNEQIINENRSGASHRPQSEQQQDREPCAFCKQWGTQATRTLGVGSALKPAHEPICVARKPLEKGLTIATNVLKYGTGGINIDESRVETSDKYSYPNGAGGNSFSVGEEPDGKRTEPVESNSLGRFPANLIHDNSEEVRECFPDSKSSNAIRHNKKDNFKFFSEGEKKPAVTSFGFSDEGNASRFFKSIIYKAKASKSDRGEGNIHATVKPTALMEYLINMVSREGAIILDPFMGSGTTGVACRESKRNFIGIEKDETYFKIAQERINNAQLPLI